MSTDFMLTIPKDEKADAFGTFMAYVRRKDLHKWVIGDEKGRNGYRHYQCRVRVREDAEEAFTELKEVFPTAHIEQCSDVWEYETKEGRFTCSEDRPEILAIRFGKEREYQRTWSALMDAQTDREVTIFYDPDGNFGKSWWAIHHWETRHAHVVNPNGTAKTLMQDVASKYATQGYRPWLLIDIPRTWKWTEELYYAIEKIKDGLISDPRYGATDINIRGVRVGITCNEAPRRSALSDDRWVVWNVRKNWLEWDNKTNRTLP